MCAQIVVPVDLMHLSMRRVFGLPVLEGCAASAVTKRRSSWACIVNPKLEQETTEGTEGTHARQTPAHQRRPSTLHEVKGSKPPIGALYMQLAKIPPTHHTTPPATSAPGAEGAASARVAMQAAVSLHSVHDGAS